MKWINGLGLFIFFSFSLQAQYLLRPSSVQVDKLSTTYHISGKLISESGKPIEFAAVGLYGLSDSTVIHGALSDSTGWFLLTDLSSGQYRLSIQMLGYEDWEKEISINIDIALDTITLKTESNTLNEVEVVAERSTVENKLGKKVLRIGQDLSATGSNALEALDIIPSVSTTQKGKISIRGTSNIIIYINGKETRRDPATLKFISADQLDRIEIITNPSAKYDAEGVGGIINLVYKKNKKASFKLEVVGNLSAATNPFLINPDAGINASINKNKISLFANVSFEYGKYEDYAITNRKDFQSDLLLYNNKNTIKGSGLISNGNLGFSFEPDSTLSMGLEVNYSRWDLTTDTDQRSTFEFNNGILKTGNINSERGELENELWINYSLEKKFKEKQKLKIAVSTGGEDERNFKNGNNVNIDSSLINLQPFLQSSHETEKQRYYQAKLDFESPFFKLGKIETGAKLDVIRYNIFQEVMLASDTIVLPDNDFSMDMQKLGIYLLQNHQIKKLKYSLGLRLERFSSDAVQRSTEEKFTQKYLRLFPSVQLHYLLPDLSHSIGFAYTRRIYRPGFFDLNPFVSYEDPLNLKTGNPALRPEIANLYEMNYHKELGSWNYDLTLFRSVTTDAIQSTVNLFAKNQTLSSTINIGKKINQGMEGQLEFTGVKFLKATATFALRQLEYSDVDNEISHEKTTTWSVRLKQQFRIDSYWKIEFSETYRAPIYQIQQKTRQNYYLDFGISKSFDNKRGSVSLSVKDVFNSRNDVQTLSTSEFELERSYNWQTRQINLGLRYYVFN